MIEGLKLTIPGNVLQAHFYWRQTYHEQRAVVIRKQLETLSDAGIAMADAGVSSYTNNDPRSGMKDKAQAHDKRAAYFAFLGTHLEAVETYRLGVSDLLLLEIE